MASTWELSSGGMKRNGMVLIRNNCHNLFCHFYSISYDQIGFVHDGKLWLFWAIPTETKPYIGWEDEFELKGAKEYFAELNVKNCPLATFATSLHGPGGLGESLRQSSAPKGREGTSTLIRQYSEKKPIGLKFINKVLSAIGCINLSPHAFSESQILGKFLPPVLVRTDGVVITPYCQDLLEMVMHFPETLITKQESRLRKLTIRASEALFHLLHCSVLEEELVAEYSKLVADIESCLPDNQAERTTETPSDFSKDRIIIVQSDGSARSTVVEIRRLVKAMLEGEQKIDLSRLLAVMNKLFPLFNVRELKVSWPQLPFSHFVAVVSPDDPHSGLRTSEDKQVCLSGDGLESLNSEELEELIRDLNTREDDNQFDHLRTLATQLYYQRKPS